MRALKTIVIILLALAALVVLLGLMGPKDFRVERSTVVGAPASAVYSNVSSLAAQEKWGPWKEMEHNMTSELSGSPDGQVGAISHWKSDESEGEQELKELVPNKSVRTELRFISPWAATNEGTFALEEMGDSTKVTWGIQGHNDFMGRVMGVFMNMDEMVGPMFEKGLGNLKTVTETEHAAAAKAPAAATFEVMSGDRPMAMFIGIKSDPKFPQADLDKFYMENTPRLFEALGKAGVKPAGPLCGLYYDWDETNKTTSVMVCVPVAEKVKVPGLTNDNVPEGKAYWTVMHGGYHGMYTAHDAVNDKLEADGMVIGGVVLEEYVAGQGTEPDSTKWVTNIIYMAKPKG